MPIRHHLFTATKQLVWLYLLSLVAISFLAAFLAARGARKPIAATPLRPYESGHFASHARDMLTIEAWYFPGTNGQILVIAPGWGGNRATLLALAESVNATGTAVLTFDPRGGSGRNTYGEREAGDIAGAVAYLSSVRGYEPKDIVLLGHSMGGAAVLSYAPGHDLGGVILVSSVYDLQKTRRYFARDYHLILPNLYALGARTIERIFFALHPADPRERFALLTVPTLVMHSVADEKAPIQDVEEIAARYRGDSRVTVRIAAEGKHTYFLTDPEGQRVLSDAVTVFLAMQQDARVAAAPSDR